MNNQNDINLQVNNADEMYTKMYIKVAKYLGKDTVFDAVDIIDYIVSAVKEKMERENKKGIDKLHFETAFYNNKSIMSAFLRK